MIEAVRLTIPAKAGVELRNKAGRHTRFGQRLATWPPGHLAPGLRRKVLLALAQVGEGSLRMSPRFAAKPGAGPVAGRSASRSDAGTGAVGSGRK